MRLTPQQEEQVEQARAAGENRAVLSFTSQQKAEWQAAVQQELAGRDQNIDHIRKLQAAAQQHGFFGDVRRAMAVFPKSVRELADEIGVSEHLLADFRAGNAELPCAALDRLIQALGLRLMQEIPRART
jgi:hypothetical protein